MSASELYRFVEGATVWTVTSADSLETHNGEVYIPAAIGRSAASNRVELSKANLQVTVSLNSDFGRRWASNIIDKPITLTVFEKDGATVGIVWKGRFAGVRVKGVEIILTFESIFTSMRRPGLSPRHQKLCRHSLYKLKACRLVFEDFATPDTPTSVIGVEIDVPAAGLEVDGYFIGGVVKASDGTLGYIIDHVGTLLTLQRPLEQIINDDLSNGYGNNYGNVYGGVVVINIYPGCDKSRQTCLNKFNNLDNYGGLPWIPSRNPMDGSSLL